MKIKILYIFLSILFVSCTGRTVKNGSDDILPELTLQTAAAFKNAEIIYENEWKLIFRKLDNSQYIILYTDISKISSFKENLIIPSDGTYITNPDFVNLRFNIYYVEETAPDPETEETRIIYRLRDITRIQSDRYSIAGFTDDIQADDFILKLKYNVKNDSASEISEMISYPITAVINKKKFNITNSEIFIKHYSLIFNKKVKNAIIKQPLADITANSKGLKIGDGELWINIAHDKILITAINN